MADLPAEIPVIEGLSKREQSKLQRLIKSTEAQKANTHSKSYKRKPIREKPALDQPQRKLLKTQTIALDNKSDSGSSPVLNGAKPQSNQVKPQRKNKVDPKQQKAFNPKFLNNEGEDGLFQYIMMYSYSEKEKKMESPEEDLSFIESLHGTKLNLQKDESLESNQQSIMNKFKLVKDKIEQPFDDEHWGFIRQNFKKNQTFH